MCQSSTWAHLRGKLPCGRLHRDCCQQCTWAKSYCLDHWISQIIVTIWARRFHWENRGYGFLPPLMLVLLIKRIQSSATPAWRLRDPAHGWFPVGPFKREPNGRAKNALRCENNCSLNGLIAFAEVVADGDGFPEYCQTAASRYVF